MGKELKKFFATTLEWNGRGQRPDVQVPVSMFGAEKVEISDLSGDADTSLDSLHYFHWYLSNTLLFNIHPSPPPLATPSLNNSRDALGRVVQFSQNSFLQRNPCMFATEEHSYFLNKQLHVADYGVNKLLSRGASTNFHDVGIAQKANLDYLPIIDNHLPHICSEERARPQGSARDSPDSVCCFSFFFSALLHVGLI